MNPPLRILQSLQAARNKHVAIVVGTVLAAIVFVVSIVALARSIEFGVLRTIGDRAGAAPFEAITAGGAFLAAFALRAQLWTRVLPGLSFGHSLAGIMVATGANHVLPFRLGEPLRIVSIVRRAGMRADDATASTVALRVGDALALLLIGAVLGPRFVIDSMGVWGLPVIVLLLAMATIAAISIRRGSRDGRLRTPGAAVFAGVVVAWFLEAVLVWRIAVWAGAELSYRDAVVVGSVGVVAQLVAIAPGGIGTYEAAAVIAMTAAGVSTGDAVTIAIAIHAAKTILTIAAGMIAVFYPAPTMFGRLRVPSPGPVRPDTERPPRIITADGSPRPVVLFLPAFEESPRIASVIRQAPAYVLGHPVAVVVVDDGSTDPTATIARAAGATVVVHRPNRGLGAAVATGLRVGVESDAIAIAFCDADGEYDPAELKSLVSPIIEGEADYVVGSRFAGTIEHMRPHRWFGNKVLTRWIRWMARTSITDGQSGYRALSYRAANEAVLAHDYNYAQVLTLDLVMRGFRYHEVPIRYNFRVSGRSFVSLGRYLQQCVPAAWRVVNDHPTHARHTVPLDSDRRYQPRP